MPNSLRTRIKKLAYQNVISEKDRDRIINALDVAEKETDNDCISKTKLLKHTYTEYDDNGVGHVYVEDVESLPSANRQEPQTDYKSFCEWVASEVIDGENWEWNSGSFPEVACRKLNKLGVVDTDGKRWIYENESIEQEPCEDCISREAVLNTLDTADKFLDEDRTVERYKALLTEAYKVLPSVNQKEPQTKWIPVSEKLPKKNVEVLATTKWDTVTIAEMYSMDDWLIYEGAINAEIDEIVAWSPLPEPYKTEGSDEE